MSTVLTVRYLQIKLLDLPDEVILRIIRNLYVKDFKTLRTTCKKFNSLVEDEAIINRIDQLIYISVIIRYQVELYLGANVEDRAQSALGAEFSSGLCENIFKRKIYIWIFVMKKANPTFETFKMLNADLSQEDNYFTRECQFKESYLKLKKGEKKKIDWEGKLNYLISLKNRYLLRQGFSR